MLTTLLQPGNNLKRHPLIEVLEGTREVADVHINHDSGSDMDEEEHVVLGDNEYDWSIPQLNPMEISSNEIPNISMQMDIEGGMTPKISVRQYGFADYYSHFFEKDLDYIKEVMDNPSPDDLSLEELRALRVSREEEDLDEDTLWNDSLSPDEELRELLKFVSPIRSLLDSQNEMEIHELDESIDLESNSGNSKNFSVPPQQNASKIMALSFGGVLEFQHAGGNEEASFKPSTNSKKNRVMIEEIEATNSPRNLNGNGDEQNASLSSIPTLEEDVEPMKDFASGTIQESNSLPKNSSRDPLMEKAREGRIMIDRVPNADGSSLPLDSLLL
jgi:hypothetical protein